MHGMILEDAERRHADVQAGAVADSDLPALCRSQHRWFSRRPEHQGDVITTSTGVGGWLNGIWVAIISVVVLLQTPAAVNH